jgi:hypothetical protein
MPIAVQIASVASQAVFSASHFSVGVRPFLSRERFSRLSRSPDVPAISPQLFDFLGGRTRARTWDPLIKSQLLYQLSYAPAPTGCASRAARVV